MSTASAVGLPPDEAIRFFRQKLNTTSEHWTDVWNEAHSRAFMVAGAASDALVEDLRHEVSRAIEQGTTLKDFSKQFDAIVENHGWEARAGEAGSKRRAWRAQIIYETNLSTAYSAGRYAQMTHPDVLEAYPFWQYVHNTAMHPRQQHLAWDGLVLRADDGWWSTHYPPNGWRCHCSVRILGHHDLGRLGKRAPDKALPLDLRPWRNPRTGKEVMVPRGIDPGFGYNPGKAWLDGEDLRGLHDGRPPRAVLPSHAPRQPLRAEAIAPAEGLPSLTTWLQHPAGEARVGAVPERLQRFVSGHSADVRLSADTMEKQGARHAELASLDYEHLPALLASPVVALPSRRARHAVLYGLANGALYRIVIKGTRMGDATYIVSFHRSRLAEAQRDIAASRKLGAPLFGSVAALQAAIATEKKSGAPVGPPGNPT